MQKILVIRFGSLGDLCLLAWTLQRLDGSPATAGREVTLVTKAAFAPLLAQAAGIHHVEVLAGSDLASLARTAARLRRTRWDVIIDAHSVLRSRLLLLLLGRRADAALDKDTRARLALLKFGRNSSRLQRTMHDRFDAMLKAVPGFDAAAGPAVTDATRPPLVGVTASAAPGPRAVLGLAPGAQWDTKRWPAEKFAALLHGFRLANPGPVRIFLGPREQTWFTGSPLAAAARTLPDIDVVADLPLPRVAEELSRCDLLLTNDSGLLHVAEAVGTPVLALFGPTVRQFGYFPCLPASGVLERDLACRPCSRNGKRPCHRGDLACLDGISVDEVLADITRRLDVRSQPAEEGS